MEFDDQTARLFATFMLVNVVALVIAYRVIQKFGSLEGLVVFTFLVLTLPVVAQYYILKKNVDSP